MTGEDRQLAVSYVLGELAEDERAAFERRLAAEPDLRRHVDGLLGPVGSLRELPDAAWEAAEPPALGFEPRAETSRGGFDWRRWLTPPRLAIAGGLAAAALAVGVVVGGDDGDPGGSGDPRLAASGLAALQGTPAEASALIEPAADGSASLAVENLPEGPAHHHYELWLLSEGEPVSVGTFTVDADGVASLDVELPDNAERFDSFDISIERDGGDPSHSGESVLRGPVVSQSS